MHAPNWEQMELPMPRTAVWDWQLHQSLYKDHICFETAAMQPCTQLRVASYTEQALLQDGAFLASQVSGFYLTMP
jgi:hypothetical protein